MCFCWGLQSSRLLAFRCAVSCTHASTYRQPQSPMYRHLRHPIWQLLCHISNTELRGRAALCSCPSSISAAAMAFAAAPVQTQQSQSPEVTYAAAPQATDASAPKEPAMTYAATPVLYIGLYSACDDICGPHLCIDICCSPSMVRTWQGGRPVVRAWSAEAFDNMLTMYSSFRGSARHY